MSRFGNTGTFYYKTGDALTSPATVLLDPGQMPQYPFENTTVTDRITYRSKNGKSWMYENYNLDAFTFRWSLLDETKRNHLRTMYDAKPILSFISNGVTFGTFRIADASWRDEEVAFELFDITFTLEEVV